jgi:hypothetical protein
MEPNKLTEALNAVLDRLQKVETFVLSELPIICHELVNRQIFRNRFNIGILGSLSLLFATLIRLCIGGLQSHEDNFAQWTGIVVLGIATIISVCCMLDEIKELYEMKIAPKLFLVEHIKELLSSNKE